MKDIKIYANTYIDYTQEDIGDGFYDGIVYLLLQKTLYCDIISQKELYLSKKYQESTGV